MNRHLKKLGLLLSMPLILSGCYLGGVGVATQFDVSSIALAKDDPVGGKLSGDWKFVSMFNKRSGKWEPLTGSRKKPDSLQLKASGNREFQVKISDADSFELLSKGYLVKGKGLYFLAKESKQHYFPYKLVVNGNRVVIKVPELKNNSKTKKQCKAIKDILANEACFLEVKGKKGLLSTVEKLQYTDYVQLTRQ